VQAELVSVQDGATIRVRLPEGNEALVLLIGIDAPAPTECYGAESAARPAELLRGRTVELEADQTDKDKDGRLLRYVWVWGEDGVRRHVNEEMAKGGLAGVYDAKPNSRYQAALNEAQRAAQAQKVGLWAECGKVHTPRKPPKIAVEGRAPTTTTIGADFRFVITITNQGPQPIDNLAIHVSQNYLRRFVRVGALPAYSYIDSSGSGIYVFGPLAAGQTQTYTIALSPKEAGNFTGPTLIFDRGSGGGIGTQLQFSDGNYELWPNTVVLSR
jgi:micrococcal nuclease